MFSAQYISSLPRRFCQWSWYEDARLHDCKFRGVHHIKLHLQLLHWICSWLLENNIRALRMSWALCQLHGFSSSAECFHWRSEEELHMLHRTHGWCWSSTQNTAFCFTAAPRYMNHIIINTRHMFVLDVDFISIFVVILVKTTVVNTTETAKAETKNGEDLESSRRITTVCYWILSFFYVLYLPLS